MPASTSKMEYWCIFRNDQLLVVNKATLPELIQASDMTRLASYLVRKHKLIELDQAIVYGAELLESFVVEGNYQLLPLRKALDSLGREWYGSIAKAFSIVNWDKNHQFCGRCSTKLQDKPAQSTASYERECPACHLLFYPRISPSIIVRIKKGNQILMARSHHFPPGAYALIAGFVEGGESLEEAVHREVFEEVGIHVKNLQYVCSQPWPFPDTLMIAFTADYADGELKINPTEIEDAGWYTWDKLPGRPTSKISIGSKLIDDFIAESQGK